MSVTEPISEKVSSLPNARQVEVLNFVEFLLQKTDYEADEWIKLSLNLGMQGLENDNFPEYSLSDLKERW